MGERFQESSFDRVGAPRILRVLWYKGSNRFENRSMTSEEQFNERARERILISGRVDSE